MNILNGFLWGFFASQHLDGIGDLLNDDFRNVIADFPCELISWEGTSSNIL
jgi:hypothetical protein